MMQHKKWEKGLLRADGKPGFETPSGKLEAASSVLAEHGYDPLPVYTEPREGPLASPELAARFPLVFNSGARTRYDFRSQHHGVAGLVEHHPEPVVTLNEQDAAERGIADGDLAWVETPRGRLRLRARVSPDLVRGAVGASMGGGGPLGPAAWRDGNVNLLTDLDHYDPISGFPVYKALLCQVRRAEGEARAAPANESGCAVGETVETEPPAAALRVYLDNNATTPLEPEALDAMLPFLREEHGNPSSVHELGTRARAAVEAARRRLAQTLGCTARRLVFTGSGSEADNLAIKGAVAARREGGRHLIASEVEHPAVRETIKALERDGYEASWLPVDHDGLVEPRALEAALRPDTVLVSVMAANNEVGTLQPIAELAQIARAHGALFHCDAVQALGRIPLDVEALGVDLLAVSAHKIGGPKGVGALFVRAGVELSPLIHGGGQERGLRSGTENVAGIVGFGKACELAGRRLNAGEAGRLSALRDRLEAGIRQVVPGARLNGHRERRLPNTLNVTLPGIRGESLVLLLDRRGVRFSSGSACKSGNPDPSHALLAMGLTAEEAHCAVRFSLGACNDQRQIDATLEALELVLRETREAVRFVACR
jgi:cysteine desulfurase NifS